MEFKHEKMTRDRTDMRDDQDAPRLSGLRVFILCIPNASTLHPALPLQVTKRFALLILPSTVQPRVVGCRPAHRVLLPNLSFVA